MPELPEVETIRRQLEQRVRHETVDSITVLWQPVLRGDRHVHFIDASVIAVKRFGKLLVLDFSNQMSLCIHLKMTGRLSLLRSVNELLPHTRVYIKLRSKNILAFSDSRKFGYVHVLPTLQLESLPFLSRLGKEPLKDLLFEDFVQQIQKTSRPIKSLLLDQTKIAGIGNIYACDALWVAHIDPKRPAKDIDLPEAKRLFSAIEDILTEGIQRGGASDNTYRDLFGQKGEYQNFFKVYGRTGKPCPRCQSPIQRCVIGGRGTWYCSTCQPNQLPDPIKIKKKNRYAEE